MEGSDHSLLLLLFPDYPLLPVLFFLLQKNDGLFDTRRLVQMAVGVASGMTYLAGMGFVHRVSVGGGGRVGGWGWLWVGVGVWAGGGGWGWLCVGVWVGVVVWAGVGVGGGGWVGGWGWVLSHYFCCLCVLLGFGCQKCAR